MMWIKEILAAVGNNTDLVRRLGSQKLESVNSVYSGSKFSG